MHVGIILLVFVVIFAAELPDKSLFAALVLGNRFNPFYVWLGAALAFFTHVVIAVSAGKLLTFLPHTVTAFIISGMFFAGALLLFFGKHGVEEATNHEPQRHAPKTPSFWRVFTTSFTVVFLGEWGDITQIATANYAAKYHDPWSVGIGATLGLWAVTGLAVTLGSKLLTRIPTKLLLRIMGGVMLVFALISLRTALLSHK